MPPRDAGHGHWTDISGNLHDAPVNGMVIWHGHLVVAGTAGVFTAAVPRGDAVPAWSRLGAPAGHRRPTPRRAPGSGYEQAKAELCRVEIDEVAVAFGPPA